MGSDPDVHMPRRFRKTPWTRQGCGTCKRRRKKCDEQKPRCGACTRLNLECVQSEVFCVSVHEPVTEPPASRNKPDKKTRDAGSSPVFLHFQPLDTRSRKRRRGSVSPHRPQNTQPQAAATPSSLLQPDGSEWDQTIQIFTKECERQSSPNRLEPCGQDAQSPWGFGQPEFSMTPTAISGSTAENQLFQYYVERLISSMSNADGAWSPLRKVVISRALSSQTLFDAVCACAAAHWAKSSGTSAAGIFHMSMKKYVKAMSSMNRALGSGGLDSSFREDLLLTSIFLCKYEIIKDGLKNWRPHLNGIISLYDQAVKSSASPKSNDAVAFAKSFITYHSCIASLTTISTRSNCCTSSSLVQRPALETYEDTIDLYTGYSEHLFILLQRVMELLTYRLDNFDDAVSFQNEVEDILYILHSRQATFNLRRIEDSVNPTTFDNLYHIAQALKGIIYVCLHSVIAEVITQAEKMAELFSFIPRMVPVTKEAALQASIDAVNRVESDGQVEAALLPILFIIACEGRHMDMEMALRRVEAFSDAIGMGNQRSAARLLRDVWTQRKGHVEMGWRGFIATSAYKELILT